MRRPLTAASGDPIDRVFEGEVTPWIYAVLRVGIASLFIVRHADWLRPWIWFEHHAWVHGLEFSWSARRPPYLESPFVPWLVLTEASTAWLLRIRTVLSFLLLLGVRARGSALLLAIVSYALLASDRYRYFHHLHLLYVSLAWLSLSPIGDRLDLERVFGAGGERPAVSAFWPLRLIQAGVLSVYLAAGAAKLDPEWWSGRTLEALDTLRVVHGPFWDAFRDAAGFAGVARSIAVFELLLPVFLVVRCTRRSAVFAAAGFHLLLSTCMAVSIFGAEMVVLLLAFVPARRTPAAS